MKIFFRAKEDWNPRIFSKMSGTRENYVKQNEVNTLLHEYLKSFKCLPQSTNCYKKI